ncbi:lysophospholipid acyltransferase family protein [Tautonia sp. JC769]|uniref:lysophospholipid acyltransferase family protein n=1 Tax=Tautonia sp. JC769 TaxID=3232135 RepID=UPI0034573B4C
MRLIPGHLTSWKHWYYRALIPALRRLGPDRADAVLDAIGRAVARRPGRSGRITARLADAREGLRADWDLDETRDALVGNLARFSARDCLLSGLSDDAALGRFEVTGAEHLDAAIATGKGVILLGAHFGAYLAAMHWLVRRRAPLRMMLQRPRHVSDELSRWFDRAGTPDDPIGPVRHPQSSLFLRRSMPPGEGVLRVLRARSALLGGLAVLIHGDVAWDSRCARPGSLLGRPVRVQAAWADLAVVTGAPVMPIFCAHRAGGRFALTIDPPWSLAPGDQRGAVTRYLDRLDSVIAAEPAEAVSYLLWPDDRATGTNVEGRRPRRRPEGASSLRSIGA